MGFRWVAGFALLFCSALFARDQYYMILWSFDGNPEASLFDTDHWGHTFATYAHVDVNGTSFSLVETRSISWLPKPLDMNPMNGVMAGFNYTMADTFGRAELKHFRLSRSGPWPISQEYFETAERESDQLSDPSHTDRYAMLDHGLRPSASNCYDKVVDVGGYDGFDGKNNHGLTASVLVLRWLEARGHVSELQDSGAIWLGQQLLQLYQVEALPMQEFRAATTVTDALGREL